MRAWCMSTEIGVPSVSDQSRTCAHTISSHGCRLREAIAAPKGHARSGSAHRRCERALRNTYLLSRQSVDAHAGAPQGLEPSPKLCNPDTTWLHDTSTWKAARDGEGHELAECIWSNGVDRRCPCDRYDRLYARPAHRGLSRRHAPIDMGKRIKVSHMTH